MSVDGVLVIDKPPGMTSHDVVDEVRRRFATRKVGHGGTLDPDATGVLLVGLGRATRFISYAQQAPKTYRAGARFGVTTSTQDASGDVLEERPVEVTRDVLEAALEGFRGAIEQTPPMVSAVKVGGERLYRKARRGEEVEREPRHVTVYEFDVVDFETPDATLDVRCSGGTYVRTLIHDLGTALGCGAHLTSLRRVEACGFGDDEAVPMAELGPGHMRPLIDAVGDMERLEATPEQMASVRTGRPLAVDDAAGADALVAVVFEGRLLGVYRREGHRLVPDRVVPA